jgi:hypothetical protein
MSLNILRRAVVIANFFMSERAGHRLSRGLPGSCSMTIQSIKTRCRYIQIAFDEEQIFTLNWTSRCAVLDEKLASSNYGDFPVHPCFVSFADSASCEVLVFGGDWRQ